MGEINESLFRNVRLTYKTMYEVGRTTILRPKEDPLIVILIEMLEG
jgi:hypothetical protein